MKRLKNFLQNLRFICMTLILGHNEMLRRYDLRTKTQAEIYMQKEQHRQELLKIEILKKKHEMGANAIWEISQMLQKQSEKNKYPVLIPASSMRYEIVLPDIDFEIWPNLSETVPSAVSFKNDRYTVETTVTHFYVNNRGDFTRIPITEEQRDIVKKKVAEGGNSWLPFDNGYIPTPEEVNEWNLKGMGHDSINAWRCIEARLKREKKPYKCIHCKGTGENWQHPKAKRLHKRWKPFDPPAGDGFQLWGTTGEGEPMTPVFDSLEKLCEYCENENVSVFGKSTATKERWMEMLGKGFVYKQEGNMIFV